MLEMWPDCDCQLEQEQLLMQKVFKGRAGEYRVSENSICLQAAVLGANGNVDCTKTDYCD